jgi:hypothetical protein
MSCRPHFAGVFIDDFLRISPMGSLEGFTGGRSSGLFAFFISPRCLRYLFGSRDV